MLEPLRVLKREREQSRGELSEARAEQSESETKNQSSQVLINKQTINTFLYRLQSDTYNRVTKREIALVKNFYTNLLTFRNVLEKLFINISIILESFAILQYKN